jgi:hypothetical protein
LARGDHRRRIRRGRRGWQRAGPGHRDTDRHDADYDGYRRSGGPSCFDDGGWVRDHDGHGSSYDHDTSHDHHDRHDHDHDDDRATGREYNDHTANLTNHYHDGACTNDNLTSVDGDSVI